MPEGDRLVDGDKPADEDRPFGRSTAMNAPPVDHILGGLGSIIVGAVLIGGAIALARTGTPPSEFSWQGWLAAIGALLLSVAFLAACCGFSATNNVWGLGHGCVGLC
jgi:hypothetical protein